MSKYQRSIIYKIFDNTNGNVYYGSTYNLLRVRMQGHKDDAKIDTKNGASKQIILNGNYSYSMVEPYPCNSKQELHTRERYWIENFDCVNKKVPTRTKKEHYNDNKQLWKDREANNKEYLKEYRAEYRTKNKEEICKKNAEYHTKNKVKNNQNSTNYYTKNKDKILEKNATIIVCECGSESTYCNIKRHRKTAKHAKLLALVCSPCNDTPLDHLQK